MMALSHSDVPWQCFASANPNHSAALICALVPFRWGWRRCAWLGWAALSVLCVMLAMTQSRTGLALMAIEAIAMSKCKVESVKCKMAGVVLAVLGVAVAVWWMWPRLTIDDSILNRPRIWLAGRQLFAANPSGVGFGNSGVVTLNYVIDVDGFDPSLVGVMRRDDLTDDVWHVMEPGTYTVSGDTVTIPGQTGPSSFCKLIYDGSIVSNVLEVRLRGNVIVEDALILKGTDSNYYKITVGAGGAISATLVE